MNSTNKTALITGASSNIRASFAYFLAALRNNLFMAVRSIDNA